MTQYEDTQVWLGGLPVQFVRWGSRALVYVNIGSESTLSSLRRNTVQRLLQDGVLHIEGYRPDWADLTRISSDQHH